MVRSRYDCCIAGAEPLERRVLFAGAELEVAIGSGGSRSVSFIDADGTSASISVRGAAALVRFAGEGMTQAPSPHGVTVSGTAVTLAALAVTETSRRSAVTFTASGGDGRLAVGRIDADGAVGRIDGRPVILTGPLTTGGPVGRLLLLATQNASITLGGGAGASSVSISEAAFDTDLTSAAPIRRLTLGSWTGADGGDTITAPSIGTALVAGTFTGNISLSSAGSLAFGLFKDSTLTVSGDVRSASFESLNGSSMYVGVRPLPGLTPVQSLSDFVAPSTIGRLRVGWVQTFTSSDSVIAARFMGRVVIGDVLSDFDSFADHSIVADRIDHLKVKAHTTHRPQPPVVRSNVASGMLKFGVLRIDAL
jgi:hypothetical protein